MLSEASTGDRQQKSSNDPQERELRETEAHQLIHDLIGRNVEYFSSPENRLDFIKGTDADGFFRIAQHINAKLRGEKPWELRQRDDELSGYVSAEYAIPHEEKSRAFCSGYVALQEYLQDSTDSPEKKLEGAAMAVEALFVWVHPFNDGNGRTSRFLGKFIEDGPADVDDLVSQTVSGVVRKTVYSYSDMVESRDSLLAFANCEEFLLDDDERDELRRQAQLSPDDAGAMYLSVKRLLESDELRARTKRYQRKEPLAA